MAPTCELGYTRDDLWELFGSEIELRWFDSWTVGQTQAVCDEHGVATYPWDVDRYLAGLR